MIVREKKSSFPPRSGNGKTTEGELDAPEPPTSDDMEKNQVGEAEGLPPWANPNALLEVLFSSAAPSVKQRHEAS